MPLTGDSSPAATARHTDTTTATNNSIPHETTSDSAHDDGRSLQHSSETTFSRDQSGVREEVDILSHQQQQQQQQQLQQPQNQVGLSQPQQQPEQPQPSIDNNIPYSILTDLLKQVKDAELRAANAELQVELHTANTKLQAAIRDHGTQLKAIDVKFDRDLLSLRAQMQNQNMSPSSPSSLGQATRREGSDPGAVALQLQASALAALSATVAGSSSFGTVNTGRGEYSNPLIEDTVPMSPSPQSQHRVTGAIALASSPPPPTPTSISIIPRELEQSAAPSQPTSKPVDQLQYANRSHADLISDRYVLIKGELGSGGSATVYKCLDIKDTSRKLALRVVKKPRKENNPDQIQKEVALMRKLKHRNIIQLHEFFDCEDKWYMVLEYCERVLVKIKPECDACKMLDRPIVHGDCLSKLFTEEKCRDIFRQMVLGIEYLHAKGAIHRDIKPGNLLLSKAGVLKICDFGISQVFPDGGDKTIDRNQGTRLFMAPEFIVGCKAEPTDIWSMGVTLYVMAYGALPFPSSDTKPKTPLYDKFRDQEKSKSSSPLWSLIKGLLERNPLERITMDQLREDPWLTNNDLASLPSKADNIGEHIVLTKEEIRSSIITTLVVSKFVNKLKDAARRRALNRTSDSGLTETSHTQMASDESRLRWHYGDTDPDWGETCFAQQNYQFAQGHEDTPQGDQPVTDLFVTAPEFYTSEPL